MSEEFLGRRFWALRFPFPFPFPFSTSPSNNEAGKKSWKNSSPFFSGSSLNFQKLRGILQKYRRRIFCRNEFLWIRIYILPHSYPLLLLMRKNVNSEYENIMRIRILIFALLLHTIRIKLACLSNVCFFKINSKINICNHVYLHFASFTAFTNRL